MSGVPGRASSSLILINDGAVEIVTAHSGGWVSVYNAQGYFEPGWPQHPTSNELRGLLVSDLDGDDTYGSNCDWCNW